ncbi:Mycobacterium rhizamassiliense ORFan [Mycobacterium rhizamassiliense]|jgi:hypothetical protein|uniref:Mycobacterium rhizamassiliense ORFan n=1 Tax=Mycobacterium rhizamassiliense TaxID=1841860 RepID=A0A2U3NMF7_9MYCO|nr:Mycobacterium rhizamassiliense ORFan [Mycobacterium rhizamassiliense]
MKHYGAQQLLGQQGEGQIPGIEVPDLETVCDTFAATFLRAAGTAKRFRPRKR